MQYLYYGVAYRIVEEEKLLPFAFDNDGKPVAFKEFVTAKSPEQAANLIKFRLRQRYGEPHARIILYKNCMYVKK